MNKKLKINILLLLASILLSFYILVARQSLPLSKAVQSGQFWFMFILGIGLLHYYFKLSLKFHYNILHSDNEPILLFILSRLAVGILFPIFVLTTLMEIIFSLLNLDLNNSGYMHTEYFIVINIFWITTLGLLVYYFYNQYITLRTNETNSKIAGTDQLDLNKTINEIEQSNNNGKVESKNELLSSIDSKREFAELVLNIAVLKIHKESTIIFKRDGTWESYDNRDIINELKNSDLMLQCNRWIWINKFYIQGCLRKGDQEYITLKDNLEEKFKHIKSWNEGVTSNIDKRQSYLFISRNFKDNVHQELKNYK
jgi:hypothetical protein